MFILLASLHIFILGPLGAKLTSTTILRYLPQKVSFVLVTMLSALTKKEIEEKYSFTKYLLSAYYVPGK